jgi:sec-independent protein translocase protein TatA
MGSFSIWHLFIVLAVVLLLFGGRGKISQIMGDFAKGINAFKKGLKDEDKKVDEAENAKVIEQDKATS